MGAEVPLLAAGQLTRACGAALAPGHLAAGESAARPVLLTVARIARPVAVLAPLAARRCRRG